MYYCVRSVGDASGRSNHFTSASSCLMQCRHENVKIFSGFLIFFRKRLCLSLFTCSWLKPRAFTFGGGGGYRGGEGGSIRFALLSSYLKDYHLSLFCVASSCLLCFWFLLIDIDTFAWVRVMCAGYALLIILKNITMTIWQHTLLRLAPPPPHSNIWWWQWECTV